MDIVARLERVGSNGGKRFSISHVSQALMRQEIAVETPDDRSDEQSPGVGRALRKGIAKATGMSGFFSGKKT